MSVHRQRREEVAATIVVPTRHEEQNVGPLLLRLAHAFEHHPQSFEVLVVDDSDDQRTVNAVQQASTALHNMHHRNLFVRVHHRPRGRKRRGGLAGAVVEGTKQARGAVVVVMDGDNQHPAEIVPNMLRKVDQGTDLVVASRYRRGGGNEGLDGWWRKFVSLVAVLMARVLFPHMLRGVTDSMTGFFAVRRDKLHLDRLQDASGYKILLEILLSHLHLQRAEVPMQFQPRVNGTSKANEGNGAEFLRQMWRLRLQTLPTWVNFLVGGGAVALYGAFLLWVLVAGGVSPVAANTIQLVVTIGLNFAYNRFITWRGHRNGSLRRQIMIFGVTRAITLAASWYMFVKLMEFGAQHHLLTLEWRAQSVNAVCVATMTIINFVTSRMLFEERTRDAATRPSPAKILLRLAALVALVVIFNLVVIAEVGAATWLVAAVLLYTLLTAVVAWFELYWRIYARRTPDARQATKFPEPVPQGLATHTFSLIVPAKNEPLVIAATLRQLLNNLHPRVQIVVSLIEGDDATIYRVVELAGQHPGRVDVVVERYPKTGKPYQLNEALKRCTGDYVGVVDAETLVHPELLLRVEGAISQANADVVQCGVLLTNLDLAPRRDWERLASYPRLHRMVRPFFTSGLWRVLRGWWCVHNAMEYFFWWSSRIFFQVKHGFVPLGGNSLFIRRSLLNKVGGWPTTLVEDCSLGIRLSVLENAKIIALYETRFASREETPPRVFGPGGRLRQGSRWAQGFIAELLQGTWLKLPTLRQRLLAGYTLVMPSVQAVNGVMLPLAVVFMLLLKAPVGLVMLMFAALVPMGLMMAVQLMGLREFARETGQKARLRHYLSLTLLGPLYQGVLALSAIHAVRREIGGQQDWLATARGGAHMDGHEPAPRNVVSANK